MWLKDVVHHVLEGCGRVAEPEIHDHGFIQPILCLERGFVLVSIFDAYFVKASFYVELGEDERILYFCDKFWYEGKWVSIANRSFVNTPVVLYWSL